MISKDSFELAAGSVIGTEHVRVGKSNQDAHYVLNNPGILVGVICDGCGDPSSPHSEIGARLLSRMTAARVSQHCIGGDTILFRTLQHHLISSISTIVRDLLGFPTDMSEEDMTKELERQKKSAIVDHFLCTIIGFALTNKWAYFFGCGDGTLFINGEQIKLGPFPGNAPPYLAYNMLGSSILKMDPDLINIKLICQLPLGDVESFLIGSDGAGEIIEKQAELQPDGKEYVGGISQFWTNDKYFGNPQILNRKLLLMNKEKMLIDWESRSVLRHPGLLTDDTTIIVGRKKVS